MKTPLYIGLILTALFGCKYDDGKPYWVSNEADHWMKNQCGPLLNIAKTWTDTMVVFALRAGDTYHGDPTCYQIWTTLREEKQHDVN